MATGEDLNDHGSVRLTHFVTISYKGNMTRIGALRHWREFVDAGDGWQVEQKLWKQGNRQEEVRHDRANLSQYTSRYHKP
ncbi:hypothetical protein AC578_10091 [Pseudocercospora eumusae]|uniref:Uncharacterized protein n=1 Tax=Pseudocercospora eumusae TaxID=321146 RepID=A0A139GWZ1_9PEZI|nr:hypothetical protein AC578_10091 [Pseudocercospora eumusae]